MSQEIVLSPDIAFSPQSEIMDAIPNANLEPSTTWLAEQAAQAVETAVSLVPTVNEYLVQVIDQLELLTVKHHAAIEAVSNTSQKLMGAAQDEDPIVPGLPGITKEFLIAGGIAFGLIAIVCFILDKARD